jgi:predicted dehydrogenase
MSELRVGIAGVGFMGTAHARAARSAGARLVGVATSTADGAKKAAGRLGADRGFPSAAALVLADDIDVVHLCVPNNLHHELATAALENGKHVVCEKPLTLDLPSADSLLTSLIKAGTVGAVPFVYRFHPMARELRALVARGEFGRIHLLHGFYLQDWLSGDTDTDWRVGVGTMGPSRAFADIGSHWFDLAEFVLGDRVRRLSARFGTAFEGRSTEDLAVVQFETHGQVLGSAVISQVSPGRKNALVLEISGSDASAYFDQEHPDSLWIGRTDASTLRTADVRTLSPDAARHVVVPAGHPQGYLDCIDRFVVDTYAAIAGDAPEGLPTFDDGRRAVLLTEAAIRSAKEDGQWVEVSS